MITKKERTDEEKALAAARILKNYHETKASDYTSEIHRLEPIVENQLKGRESIGKFENGRFI